jgi:hypothetical protein
MPVVFDDDALARYFDAAVTDPADRVGLLATSLRALSVGIRGMPRHSTPRGMSAPSVIPPSP